jgi:hypothetical protein
MYAYVRVRVRGMVVGVGVVCEKGDREEERGKVKYMTMLCGYIML